jgi:hypothetical protein
MEIKNLIKIYDDVLPTKTYVNFLKYVKKLNFEKASVLSGVEAKYSVDFNVRKTYTHGLTNLLHNNSFSSIHWFCLLSNFFTSFLKKYPIDLNIKDFGWQHISAIDILKYENTGFYTWHTDHFADIPRTMSCILLLNNDYEGGNLCFRNPDGSGEWEVEVKSNRLIIWPSNFLYPHTVKPVTKGTRYSVVAWAL